MPALDLWADDEAQDTQGPRHAPPPRWVLPARWAGFRRTITVAAENLIVSRAARWHNAPRMKDIAELTGTLTLLVALAMFVLNVVIARAVNDDAKHLLAARGSLFLFSPLLWGIIAFVFSVAGLALYWAIHHSALRSKELPQADDPMGGTEHHSPPAKPGGIHPTPLDY